jgi:hypothetical protein
MKGELMSTKRLTAKKVKEVLGSCVDEVSYSPKTGIYTARLGFFYRHGKTAQHLEAAILLRFPHAVVVQTREFWLPFRGGSALRHSSRWQVEFRLEPAQNFEAK